MTKRFTSGFSLLVFPGQGVQKVGMHLNYQTENSKTLLDSFDEALNYPVSLYFFHYSIEFFYFLIK